MNPFHHSMEDNFRGRHVRVVSNDGEAYRGWVERLHHHDRHVVIRDATRLDDEEDVGSVLVSHADVFETVEPTSRIEAVAVDSVEPSPFAAKEFDAADNRGYLDDVRDSGFVGSFPVARERDDGRLEVVEGHKRLWVCSQAGVDEHPVEIVDVDDWEATRRFVVDHLPHEGQVRDDGSTEGGLYDEMEIRAALDTLADRWGERALELDRVAFNARRLGFDLTDEQPAEPEEDQEGDDVDEDAASSNAGGESVSEASTDTDGPEELACDVEDCNFTTESARGLAIHRGRSHKDEDDELDVDVPSNGQETLPERVKALLDENGELPGREIQLALEASDHVFNVISDLCDEGRVDWRSDPNDGRRRLYHLVEEEEEENSTTDDASEVDTDDQDADDVAEVDDTGGEEDETSTDTIDVESDEDVEDDGTEIGDELPEDLPDEDPKDPDDGLPDLDGIDIPEHLSEEMVRDAVDEGETVHEIANIIEWEPDATTVLLHRMGLYADVTSPEGRPDKVAIAKRTGEYREPTPYDVIDGSGLPARIDLPEILDAVESCDTLDDVVTTLGIDDAVDELASVLWKLELKQPSVYRLVDEDERSRRLAEIRAEAQEARA